MNETEKKVNVEVKNDSDGGGSKPEEIPDMWVDKTDLSKEELWEEAES